LDFPRYYRERKNPHSFACKKWGSKNQFHAFLPSKVIGEIKFKGIIEKKGG
jgi:hypothetical protein